MLIPTCEQCGQCGCSCGTLPYTTTVVFSGLDNRTHSAHCALTFTSNFGCGAAAVGMSPGGCPDDEPDCGASNVGPLTAVLLTEGGHDYARVGRVEPTLTITADSGTGATFTPTITPIDDTLAEQCRSYQLASVAVSGNGTGYEDGDPLLIETDGVVVTKAVAIVRTGRTEPTVTASVAGVTGAILAVTLSSNGDSPETWGVASVSVTSAGTGGTWDGFLQAPVTFATGDTTVTAATATATANFTNPGVYYYGTNGSGSGFSATLTLTEETGDDGKPQWSPSSISITNGGSGFAVGEWLEFQANGYDPGAGVRGVATYYVATVDDSGAVLTVTGPDVLSSEPFREISGIASIAIDTAGAYYNADITAASVEIIEPGEYYLEDPDAPICVAEVTVDASGCGGDDAEISVTIDDDPTSATYGQITDLTIDEAGTGYLCWVWSCSHLDYLNGESIVLTAVNPKRLVTLGIHSCYGSGACIRVVPVGDEYECDEEPTTRIADYDGGPSPIRQVEVVDAGSGYARFGRELPQWTAMNFGWTFTPTFGEESQDACGLAWWPVESLAISGNGIATYLDGWAIVHVPNQYESEFYYELGLFLVRTRESPTVTATAAGPGTGASLTVAIEEVGGFPKRWRVASVSGGGGSGYTNGVAVTFSVPPLVGFYGHYVGATATGFAIVDNDGAITSVTVTNAGEYWLDNGIPQSVHVLRKGRYYRENPALTPYVATVTVSVDQLPPSNGSGAAVIATVNSDTSSQDFGTLTATIGSQGSGYTLLGAPLDCYYADPDCSFIELRLRGSNKPPRLTVANAVLECADPLGDCDELPDSASLLYGASDGVTATIASGGLVTTECDPPQYCLPCLCPANYITAETNVSVTSNIPCAGGNASYNGPIGEFNFGCSWTNPVDNVTYESDLMLVFECCNGPEQRCNDDGTCVYLMKGRLYGSLYLPDDPDGGGDLAAGSNTLNKDSDGGCEDLVTVNLETGEVSGTVTFTVGGSTVTVTFNP